MKRPNWQLVLGLAVCALVTATTVNAKAPLQRPWKAHGITTLILDLTGYLDTGDPVCDFWADGSGEGTHVGRYTSGGVHTLNLWTGEITGECWITTATQKPYNQEQLFFRPTPISDDAFYYEITGGTGKFQNATGSFIETTVTLSEEIVIVELIPGQFRTYLIITSSYTDTGNIVY
ncbi:MAG TPA: hypothetical protein P5186_23715 [Candidatus Paceibacterota bacterium]|nr:hypothetical protein [Verrucomicrobiota bacterium]HRY51067.1 hypothetical protein [Candidatus Paceibacterota bacterium]HSA00484.1 hypothetical protein [Candidatus Paceibacterota bacterium]